MNEAKSNAIFDLGETLRISGPGGAGGPTGRAARQPAHSVHAVDPDIHERTASGERVIELPMASLHRINNFSISRKNVAEATQLATGYEVLQSHASGFKVLAVGNHQSDFVSATCVHHAPALCDGVGHRLFAEHMLAGGRSADRLFGVRAVNRGDENGFDLGVAQAALVVLVGIAVLYAKLLSQVFRSLVIVAHKRYQLALLCVLEGGKNRNLGDAAHSHHGESNRFRSGHGSVLSERFCTCALQLLSAHFRYARDFLPGSGFARALDGSQNFSHTQRFGKTWFSLTPFCDRLQEMVCFDGFQVVIPEAGAGC